MVQSFLRNRRPRKDSLLRKRRKLSQDKAVKSMTDYTKTLNSMIKVTLLNLLQYY